MEEGKESTAIKIYNNSTRSEIYQVVSKPVVVLCVEIVAWLIKQVNTSNR